jgi:hypothetical protein
MPGPASILPPAAASKHVSAIMLAAGGDIFLTLPVLCHLSDAQQLWCQARG